MMFSGMFAGICMAAPLALAQFGLDLSGYLTSTEFFGILANAISTILIALLNVITFGMAGG